MQLELHAFPARSWSAGNQGCRSFENSRNSGRFFWHDGCSPAAMTQTPINSFRDLEVWRLSMDLVDLVIASMKEMPKSEFDLRRQISRAAVSIPANIAEGYRRKKKRPAYQNHISIALGSQGELETEIEIARRNSLMAPETCEHLLALNHRVGGMLYRLHESLD